MQKASIKERTRHQSSLTDRQIEEDGGDQKAERQDDR